MFHDVNLQRAYWETIGVFSTLKAKRYVDQVFENARRIEAAFRKAGE